MFEDAGGARRTNSGHVQVQAQLPVFMQRAPEHQVVVAADENQVFSTVSALSHLGGPAGRRFGWAHPDGLASGA